MLETDSAIPSPRDLDPRVSARLEQVIMKCLRSDPEKRYADAIALQEEILSSLPGFGRGRILPEHPAPAAAGP